MSETKKADIKPKNTIFQQQEQLLHMIDILHCHVNRWVTILIVKLQQKLQFVYKLHYSLMVYYKR